MGRAEHDGEGRLLTIELLDFYLVNAYVPFSKEDYSRLNYRVKHWDKGEASRGCG
jgi:exodeoxyribonuclease-3